MGLDMYLYAEKYVSAYDYESVNGEMTRRDNLEYDRVIDASGLTSMPSAEYGSVRVSKCIAYWRKANAIHGWIIKNCAEGVDNCQRIFMDRDDLKKLRDVCVEALNNRHLAVPNEDTTYAYDLDTNNNENAIKSLLNTFVSEGAKMSKTIVADSDDPFPPVTGFFFGSSVKDEYYYDDLAKTAETINSILAHDINDEYTYYYQASW